ncbi:hypothetical protein M3650_20400 [Paenibacillus sp. MER TA 81-3]|uniref:hypothetical protein n=1 Tax=Paenibacillus sp. MER TA 81-3 TaxID=2939573 RepID=UPI00203FE13A|nr:hypothetical protein [Paenibacillus sp. MER TA 81-3]MCM3340929.1 hypothetical protein [Paenibacillus sp. MER TA 81-3]
MVRRSRAFPCSQNLHKLTLAWPVTLPVCLLAFEFVLVNPSPDIHKLRIEYGINFVKANGTTFRKLFKITENTYKNGEVAFHRTHSFKDLSTRTHYEGQHRIFIAINGREMAEAYLQLNASN